MSKFLLTILVTLTVSVLLAQTHKPKLEQALVISQEIVGPDGVNHYPKIPFQPGKNVASFIPGAVATSTTRIETGKQEMTLKEADT